MKKIYLVFYKENEYRPSELVGVCDNEQVAKNYINKHKNSVDSSYNEQLYYIETEQNFFSSRFNTVASELEHKYSTLEE